MRKILYVCLLSVLAVGMVKADIVINEVCPSNTRDIDRGWNYGGWVELYNTESYPQDLYGYYLSDGISYLIDCRTCLDIVYALNLRICNC